MVDQLSPLAALPRTGLHANDAGDVGVTLLETQPGSIIQVAAWLGADRSVMDTIRTMTGLALPDGAGGGVYSDSGAAFGFAPGKFIVIGESEGLAAQLSAAILAEAGTVTDLSHGRTAIRIEGPKAEWVLAKFFAVDFSLPAFPLGAGRSTVHHDIFAQIQRMGPQQFDIYVFRSFSRSFWKALCHASEEVGYEVR